MKKEDIEKEIRSRLDEPDNEWDSIFNSGFSRGFMAAADWRINIVWHAMDELQDGKRPYIVQYNEECKFAMFTKPISIPKEQAKSVFKRWAYMDDLIPDTED